MIDVRIDRTKGNKSVRFQVSYSSRMLNDPAGIAEELRQSAKEQGIKFDTIVGRGTSGMLIVPIVARILRKKWFIVRKEQEYKSSHDGTAKWMGELGRRWIFLDDFCSSGETFRKVRDGVREAVVEACQPYVDYRFNGTNFEEVTVERPPFETELVGYFEYESRNAEGRALIKWEDVDYTRLYWDDTPLAIAQRKAREENEAEYYRSTVTDASGTVVGRIVTDENGEPKTVPVTTDIEREAIQLARYSAQIGAYAKAMARVNLKVRSPVQDSSDLKQFRAKLAGQAVDGTVTMRVQSAPIVSAPIVPTGNPDCAVGLRGCDCNLPSELEMSIDESVTQMRAELTGGK